MLSKLLKKMKTIYYLILLKILYINKIRFGKKIGLSKGMNITIGKEGKLHIGNGVFFNRYCSINCLSSIEIGDDCIFGEGVRLYDHNHIYSNRNEVIKNQGFKYGSIKIGKNCWIGSNVVILNNVEIGDNVVIGANCLIYKNIESNSVVKSNQQLIVEQLY